MCDEIEYAPLTDWEKEVEEILNAHRAAQSGRTSTPE